MNTLPVPPCRLVLMLYTLVAVITLGAVMAAHRFECVE